jgi:hypothetical protein
MATSPAQRQQPRAALPNPRRDFFVYGVNFANIAAATPSQAAVQIQADSDFELQKITYFADIAGADQTEATRVLPLISLQLIDTGTGRQLFNTPIALPAIGGDGRIPFILPTTKIYAANSSITVAVANYSGATAYALRLALIGTKIFRYG